MNILLVSDSYPPLQGGGTRATRQLAQQLGARGHAVTVATAWQARLPSRESDGEVRIHRLRGVVSRVPALSADPVRYTPPPFPDPELVLRLAHLARHARPDVVHTYGWLTYSALWALRGTSAPVILGLRDYGNFCAVRTLLRHAPGAVSPCSGPAWRKCADCSATFYGRGKGTVAVVSVLGQRRLLRRRIQAVHSVSSFVEGTARAELFAGGGPRSSVIPDHRESDDMPAALDPAIRQRLPSEPYILFVGTYRRHKGTQVLLDAYAGLGHAPPLVMAGNRGPDDAILTSRGERVPRVVRLFDVPQAQIASLWDRALFGVCPSLAPEPFGNTVHEGMSRGRVVIGTTPGGHSDMIEDGRTGLLVPSGDAGALTSAMATLIADDELRRRLGEAARRSADAFGAEQVIPRLVDLFESLEPPMRSGAATSRLS